MNITFLQNCATADLGTTSPVAVPLTGQIAHTACARTNRDDQIETGIWECTPGRWRRQMTDQEFCYFLSGKGSFTPDGGEPLHFKAGDAFMMPANCLGVWDIEETVRKTYAQIMR